MSTQEPFVTTAAGYRDGLQRTRTLIIKIAVVLSSATPGPPGSETDRLATVLASAKASRGIIAAFDYGLASHTPPKPFRQVHISWKRATAKFVAALDEVVANCDRAERGEFPADEDWKRARAHITTGVHHLTQAEQQLARAVARAKRG